MASAALRNVTKVFDGDVIALDHLDLEIADGEVFGLVGRSGCGKSTALRLFAGLEDPTHGSVHIGDHDVTKVPTRKRNVGLVTQQDALISRRTARGNIRFPLEQRRGATLADADTHVSAQAAELGIERLLDRRPREMSSGERRAVQLARAVVARPSVLLLDEPLAMMDESLRRRLREEIVRLQRRHEVTAVLVTADQDDAIRLSDRIAVLVDGRLHQLGIPSDFITRPATVDVAAFFGEPAMNLLSVPFRRVGAERRITLMGHDIRVWSPLLDVYDRSEVVVGIRPADLAGDDGEHDSFPARVASVAPYGHCTDLRVSTAPGVDLSVQVAGAAPPVDSRLNLSLRPDRFHWFDPATGMAILHPAVR